MEICEVWSISPERIINFLLSRNGVPAEDGSYSFDGCTVRVTALPDGLIGRYPIPRTQVCFMGKDEETEKLHRAFFVQFASAGG